MIRDLIATPSAFPADPAGYALNQFGHASLGAVGAWLVGWWLLPAYAALELWQWAFRGAEAWDCVEDFGHVLAGVLALLVTPAVWPLWAVFLLSGVLRRRREQEDATS